MYDSPSDTAAQLTALPGGAGRHRRTLEQQLQDLQRDPRGNRRPRAARPRAARTARPAPQEHPMLNLPRAAVRPRRRHRHAARHAAAVRRGRDHAAGRRHRPQQPVPDGPVAQVRRARHARHDRARGIRRHRHGLPGPRRRDGGDLARLGIGGPVVRRALQPVRQPDQPQRHRGAEAEVPAQAGVRRARRRARDERARRRLRRGVDEAARRPQGRPLGAQRQQDVDHQRPRRRRAW